MKTLSPSSQKTHIEIWKRMVQRFITNELDQNTIPHVLVLEWKDKIKKIDSALKQALSKLNELKVFFKANQKDKIKLQILNDIEDIEDQTHQWIFRIKEEKKITYFLIHTLSEFYTHLSDFLIHFENESARNYRLNHPEIRYIFGFYKDKKIRKKERIIENFPFLQIPIIRQNISWVDFYHMTPTLLNVNAVESTTKQVDGTLARPSENLEHDFLHNNNLNFFYGNIRKDYFTLKEMSTLLTQIDLFLEWFEVLDSEKNKLSEQDQLRLMLRLAIFRHEGKQHYSFFTGDLNPKLFTPQFISRLQIKNAIPKKWIPSNDEPLSQRAYEWLFKPSQKINQAVKKSHLILKYGDIQ
tara:strand:- start:3687 stop:4748 length:1062 start_codon:yes stop_codon:yes gene_type:complete